MTFSLRRLFLKTETGRRAADVDAAVREILALIAAKQPQAKVVFKPTQPLLKEICGK